MAEDGAAALGHAMDFALFNLEALSLREQSEHLGNHDDALAAHADDQDVGRGARGIGRHRRAIRNAVAERTVGGGPLIASPERRI